MVGQIASLDINKYVQRLHDINLQLELRSLELTEEEYFKDTIFLKGYRYPLHPSSDAYEKALNLKDDDNFSKEEWDNIYSNKPFYPYLGVREFLLVLVAYLYKDSVHSSVYGSIQDTENNIFGKDHDDVYIGSFPIINYNSIVRHAVCNLLDVNEEYLHSLKSCYLTIDDRRDVVNLITRETFLYNLYHRHKQLEGMYKDLKLLYRNDQAKDTELLGMDQFDINLGSLYLLNDVYD